MNEILDIRGRITKRRKLKRKYLYRRIAVCVSDLSESVTRFHAG